MVIINSICTSCNRFIIFSGYTHLEYILLFDHHPYFYFQSGAEKISFSNPILCPEIRESHSLYVLGQDPIKHKYFLYMF